jgi:hypothetical protein
MFKDQIHWKKILDILPCPAAPPAPSLRERRGFCTQSFFLLEVVVVGSVGSVFQRKIVNITRRR